VGRLQKGKVAATCRLEEGIGREQLLLGKRKLEKGRLKVLPTLETVRLENRLPTANNFHE